METPYCGGTNSLHGRGGLTCHNLMHRVIFILERAAAVGGMTKITVCNLHNVERGRWTMLLLSENADMDAVIDDDAYFTYSGTQMPKNYSYFARTDGDALAEVTFMQTMKFRKRVVTWFSVNTYLRGDYKNQFS